MSSWTRKISLLLIQSELIQMKKTDRRPPMSDCEVKKRISMFIQSDEEVKNANRKI